MNRGTRVQCVGLTLERCPQESASTRLDRILDVMRSLDPGDAMTVDLTLYLAPQGYLHSAQEPMDYQDFCRFFDYGLQQFRDPRFRSSLVIAGSLFYRDGSSLFHVALCFLGGTEIACQILQQTFRPIRGYRRTIMRPSVCPAMLGSSVVNPPRKSISSVRKPVFVWGLNWEMIILMACSGALSPSRKRLCQTCSWSWVITALPIRRTGFMAIPGPCAPAACSLAVPSRKPQAGTLLSSNYSVSWARVAIRQFNPQPCSPPPGWFTAILPWFFEVYDVKTGLENP